MGRVVTMRPTAEQALFHGLDCKYPAFCGGFGVGKSETMVNQAIMDASHSSDALIGLYAPTYDLVRLITAPRLEEKLTDFGISYRYNKSENIIYTSSSQFGDFVMRTMDNPARIVGYETYRAHCDEIDTLKLEHAQEAWNKIIARNRQAPIGIANPFNRVSAYSTPEGFRFMYKTWGKDPKEGYELIQASTRSNPFLPDDYIDGLMASYPEQLIKAYIDGDFVNLTSGSVYTQFDRKLNASSRVINADDHLHIGVDFNVGKMSAIVHVKDKADGLEIATAVDEIMGVLDTPALISAIQSRYPEHRVTVYPDASGNNRKTSNASETDISQLKKHFAVKNKAKNPFVKDRINAVQALLCNAKGERRYFVNPVRCPETTDSLEQQVYNKAGEPDKTHDNDHPNDALGYFINNQFPLRGKFVKAQVYV